LPLSQSLAGEILSSENGLVDLDEKAFGINSHKTATVIQLRNENRTNLAEAPSAPSPRPSPFASDSISNVPQADDCIIPTSCFKGFTEPQMKYVQHVNVSTVLVEAPDTRSIFYYSREDGGTPGEHVLVEWRSQQAESQYSDISDEQLADRRRHLVSLLHRTCAADADFRILNCLGFTLTTGRLPDGKQHPIVGFVYQLPIHAAPSPPVTLREIVGASYLSDAPNVPPLDHRFDLAHDLSYALYQLHCAGWTHRKLSSYNILYFKDVKSGEINITKPYIGGWQYARPDDCTSDTRFISEGASGRSKDKGSKKLTWHIGDLSMYMHPARLVRFHGVPLFRKSYDIYSLGIVLMEIAFWEPIVAFADQPGRDEMESFEPFMKILDSYLPKFIEATEQEIGSEMGLRYQKAVLACLQGLGASSESQKTDLACPQGQGASSEESEKKDTG
jgi:hypothetical protein